MPVVFDAGTPTAFLEVVFRYDASTSVLAGMDRLPASPLVTRALTVAGNHLGSEELSRRLRAPEDTIRAWRYGQATMPERKFLLLVDVLAELDVELEKT